MFDVVLVGFILPFAVLLVAVLGTRRAETRWGTWFGWTVGGLALLWMAGSLWAIVACC